MYITGAYSALCYVGNGMLVEYRCQKSDQRRVGGSARRLLVYQQRVGGGNRGLLVYQKGSGGSARRLLVYQQRVGGGNRGVLVYQ